MANKNILNATKTNKTINLKLNMLGENGFGIGWEVQHAVNIRQHCQCGSAYYCYLQFEAALSLELFNHCYCISGVCILFCNCSQYLK